MANKRPDCYLRIDSSLTAINIRKKSPALYDYLDETIWAMRRAYDEEHGAPKSIDSYFKKTYKLSQEQVTQVRSLHMPLSKCSRFNIVFGNLRMDFIIND